MSANETTRPCSRCNGPARHVAINDAHAGALWKCAACGYKSIRDDPSIHQVRSEYSLTQHARSFEERMRDSRFRDAVDWIVMTYLVAFGAPGQFTAAERTRIAAIVVESWEHPDEDVADELKSAGFEIEPRYVGDIRRMCGDGVRKRLRRRWWQLW